MGSSPTPEQKAAEPLPGRVEGIPIIGRTRPGPEPIPPDLLGDSVMRQAFARRDIGTVYTKLGHRGVSQRRIAALTGRARARSPRSSPAGRSPPSRFSRGSPTGSEYPAPGLAWDQAPLPRRRCRRPR
jgi:hypothetical protein